MRRQLDFMYDFDNLNLYIEPAKLVIFKNPKVAGTSLKILAAKALGLEFDTKRALRFLKIPTASLAQLQADNDLFKCIFVRSPWDRLLSCYMQKMQASASNFYTRNNIPADCSFDQFIRLICNIPEYAADRHFRSQFTNMTNPSAEIIVDYVGRFSHIEEDFEAIYKRCALESMTIPHSNTSNHRNYSSYYNDELIALVAHRYAVDIALFGFEYGVEVDKIKIENVKHNLTSEIKLKVLLYKSQRQSHLMKYLNKNSVLLPLSWKQKLKLFLNN